MEVAGLANGNHRFQGVLVDEEGSKKTATLTVKVQRAG